MNRGQSYLEGFVKRAAEHGLASNEALALLKEATTFGATRNLLRQMQSQGVKLHRTPLNMAKALAPAINDQVKQMNQINKGHKIPLPRLSSLKSEIKDTGPAYSESNIYIPRGAFKVNIPTPKNSWSNEYTSRMLPPPPPPEPNSGKIKLFNGRAKKTVKKQTPEFYKKPKVRNYETGLSVGPRATLFHEAGHAMHAVDDPRSFRLAKEQANPFGMQNPETTLARERIANNNAINFMRQNNVPNRNIENYIHNSDKSYGGYMGDLDREFRKNNTYYPGHSVQTH